MEEKPYKEIPGGIAVQIKAAPRSSRAGIDGIAGGALKVRVTCAPVDGKANKALIEVVADGFGIPKSSISFVSGETSRTKRIAIRGDAATAAKAALDALLLR